MRIIIAAALALSAPAFAQQNVTDVPPNLFSPSLLRGWQVQPVSSSPGEQAQLALRWAQEPTGIQAKSFEKNDRKFTGQQRSTVGQGDQ